MPRFLLALIALCPLAPRVSADESAAARFDRLVAPLLARRCLSCHSGTTAKGGLNLAARKAVLAGGDSGPALAPGKLAESLLWRRVQDREMPPKKPLAAGELAILKEWIAGGAAWGADPIDPFRITTEERAGHDWWALRPVQTPALPRVGQSGWARSPLDVFVLHRLEERGLAPSPPADRRTLIRRVTFDLTGLPPAPEEVEAFVADPSPGAYERLVDRLLASPHYGERWARHWLDVVRYGESDGFERDLPRLNAWPYRDWVVGALNRDLPYDQFTQLQLAGDVLRPGDPEAIHATGFLVAGPHDIVVPVGEGMKASMRQDELEDIIGTVGQTFLGLTIHCARCHDHKFDPVPQRDYYRLVAALAGVGHGERAVPRPTEQEALARARQRLDAAHAALEALEAPVRAQLLRERKTPPGPKPVAEWDFAANLNDRIGALHGKTIGAAAPARGGIAFDGKTGYLLTAPLARDLREKTLEAWVRLDRLDQRGGGVMTVQTLDGGVFDAIVFGEREAGRWMAGSDSFARTQSLAGPAETLADREPVHVALTYAADGTITGYRQGQRYGQPYRSVGPVTFKAGAARIGFGVRHEPAGGNRMLAGVVVKARLYDRALSADEIGAAAATRVNEADLLQRLSAAERQRRHGLQREIARLDAEAERLRTVAERKVYAVVSLAPPATRLLRRGQVDLPGEPVSAGAIESVAPAPADFQLPADAPEGARRLALARWITDARNPLFARVVVNRVWHYHFGVGLVDTPNDFGFNGGRPSHPELLDWLAADFARSGYRLKALHRRLVLSAAYCQDSRGRAEAVRVDADNRLLWRHAPARLEAEAIRDALLAISGDLDPALGGTGFSDTKSYFFKGTQFYDALEQIGPAFHRRTLYRHWARGGRSPFLDTFDCPDPSTTTPRRAATTTPVQALALLNNAFVLHRAERLAQRLEREAGADQQRQIVRAYRLAFQRDPSAEELRLTMPFVARHGLAALGRVIFNSNEFVQVD